MQYKIMIVDDDAALVKMLKDYFSIKGYEICTAENGIEAIDNIKNKPDIILLDINMPGLDGLEVCRQIRDKISCPILFLTAKVEEQDRVNGLLSGGDDYILKPFSREFDSFIFQKNLTGLIKPAFFMSNFSFYFIVLSGIIFRGMI